MGEGRKCDALCPEKTHSRRNSVQCVTYILVFIIVTNNRRFNNGNESDVFDDVALAWL